MFIRVKEEELIRWRDILDKFNDSTIARIADEIHDILDDNRKKVESEQQKKELYKASLPYIDSEIPRKDLKVGDEYMIAQTANFKQSYRDLMGSRVKLTDVRRTKCSVVAEETRFKGSQFTIDIKLLREIK